MKFNPSNKDTHGYLRSIGVQIKGVPLIFPSLPPLDVCQRSDRAETGCSDPHLPSASRAGLPDHRGRQFQIPRVLHLCPQEDQDISQVIQTVAESERSPHNSQWNGNFPEESGDHLVPHTPSTHTN